MPRATVVVLVAGQDKHVALRRVLGEDPAVSDAPAALLHRLPGDVAWFVDRAALFGTALTGRGRLRTAPTQADRVSRWR